MDRRTLLRRTGALSLAALAGCTGSGGGQSPLLVASEDFRFADDGSLVVSATVSNVSNARHGATLVFAPEINGETRERRVEVELATHETRVVETTYADVSESDVRSVQMHAYLEDVR